MKCPDCPVAGVSSECIAITLGHYRLCELAATRCDYRRLIAVQSTGEPSGILCPEDPVDSPDLYSPSILGSYKAMHGCRHRRVIEGECPDCVGMCTRDGDEIKRFKADCFECIDAGRNL